MITPRFSVSQDDEFIIVTLHVKYIKATDCDFFVDEETFRFYCKPYFLRLTFPHALLEDGREKAVYDIEKGELTVTVPKATAGQFFPDLDMVTKLLGANPNPAASIDHVPTVGARANRPQIEVIDDGTSPIDQIEPMEEDENEDDIDWSFPQEIEHELNLRVQGDVKYGFNRQYSHFFDHVQDEISEIVDNPNPNSVPPQDIRQMRVEDENEKFDIDHYLADFMESDMIKEAMAYSPIWIDELVKKEQLKAAAAAQPAPESDVEAAIREQQIDEESVPFSEEDRETLLKLPKKTYLVDDARPLLLGLFDILYSYAYDVRTTLGEHNVESAWTVAKISPSLAWLEPLNHPRDLVLSLVRRSLCFPLYRHFDLSSQILADVHTILRLGKRAVLRSLLRVYRLFEHNDQKHYLNGLYISDYCVWVQGMSRKLIHALLKETMKVGAVTKADVGWPLDEIERLGDEDEPGADEFTMVD